MSMKLNALPKVASCLFISLALALPAGSTRGEQKQVSAQELSAIKAKYAGSAAKQPIFCTNCARLSAHIISLPGYGCATDADFTDIFGAVGWSDPDYYIANHGNLASNPGTLTVQWYDLVAKSNVTRTTEVPSIPPGGGEVVTFTCTGILVLASEGVTLTLDYTDSAGTRHVVRKAKKCPDL
jgi:hypothetical protein